MYKFEFRAGRDFDFITEFSEQFELDVVDNLIIIPPSYGNGHIRKVDFGKDFRLLIHRYRLNRDFIIKRKASSEKSDLISIFFYNNELPLDLVYNAEEPVKFSRTNHSAIQLTTNDMNSLIRFPANTETYFIVVGITAPRLKQLLQMDKPNCLLQKITSGTASFVYFEALTHEIERQLKQLSEINIKTGLDTFYYRIKVEELLYHLFAKLLQRENVQQQIINNATIEKLLQIRTVMLADLGTPPVLKNLSEMAGMSETKLKQLFKQTFGDSIYNYYQKARMEEASFLLKKSGRSVSEIGYQLGFSNLSHFSRLFQKHYGMAPKKFQTA